MAVAIRGTIIAQLIIHPAVPGNPLKIKTRQRT